MELHIGNSEYVVQEDHCSVPLEELAAQIRGHLKAAQTAWSNALGHVLDAGDDLIKAQTRVTIPWKRWLKEHCFLAVSTAQLYTQLARTRAEIEAEIARVGELNRRLDRRLTGINQAAAVMRGGAALHLSYRRSGPQWMLSNGEPVSDAVARSLIANPNVVGIGDALFAGELSQTWRWKGGS
jgi:hypothetical protein